MNKLQIILLVCLLTAPVVKAACKCDELKIKGDCDKQESSCMWESDSCRQKICTDNTDEATCTPYFKLGTTNFERCYFLETCKSASSCADIQFADGAEASVAVTKCMLSGCAPVTDQAKCKTPTCADIPEANCNSASIDGDQCQFVSDSCSSAGSCSAITVEAACDNNDDCMWKDSACKDEEESEQEITQCSEGTDQQTCNQQNPGEGKGCVYGEECYEVSGCSDIKEEGNCGGNCHWKDDACADAKCETLDPCPTDATLYSYGGKWTTCMKEGDACTDSGLDALKEDCYTSLSQSYAWTGSECKECANADSGDGNGSGSNGQLLIALTIFLLGLLI